MRAGLVPIGDEFMSGDQIIAIYAMLCILAGLDTDHAKESNGVGFSKFDSFKGHLLAVQARARGLNRHQILAAKRMLRKYHRQIDPDLYHLVYPEYDNDSAA